ncbi:MAG: hypothetical protein Q9208_007391 [Pyrenodesmia sp. 3 TL-2023]
MINCPSATLTKLPCKQLPHRGVVLIDSVENLATRQGNSYLTTALPNELLTDIYCFLPSFSNALAFASTCHRVRDCWLTEATLIYRHIAPKSIPCERHARTFLADQHEAITDPSKISAEHVLRLMRNSRMVEQAIPEFEAHIVSRVRCGGERADDYYGAGATRHPPHLTRTERPRFIRSYYQLWGLIRLKTPVEWQARLESMTLKQLFHLYEMSMLPSTMTFLRRRDGQLDTVSVIDREPVERRVALERQILKHLEEVYRRIHGKDLIHIWVHAPEEGYGNFIAMWDHFQPSLKEVVCGRRSEEPPYRFFLDLDLWEDSSGEE